MSLRDNYGEYPKEFRKNIRERDRERSSGKHKHGKTRKVIGYVVCAILLVLVGMLAGFGVRYKKETAKILDYDNFSLDESKLNEKLDTAPVLKDSGSQIQYNGKTYNLNRNIITLGFIGIDKSEFSLEGNEIGTAGQADVIVLAVYDTVMGTLRFLAIPRDSVADIDVFDVSGGFVGVKEGQICLAYAYGDGKEQSAQNVLTSVSRLLFGIKTNYYATMELSGISSLNDAIGGISLKSIETIGSFEKGKTYTLWGDKAEEYVRNRRQDIIDADSYRQKRQRQYFEIFFDKVLENSKSSLSFVSSFYKTASQYVITNLDLNETLFLASNALKTDLTIIDYQTVPGKYTKSGKYAEYNVDSTELFEMILDLFYTEAL